jgi:hypothetical protein
MCGHVSGREGLPVCHRVSGTSCWCRGEIEKFTVLPVVVDRGASIQIRTWRAALALYVIRDSESESRTLGGLLSL